MKILDRVKRDIMREIDSQQTHTGASWADIMLRHSSRLQKTGDQKEFWAWLLDPNEEKESDEMTFTEVDPNKIELRTEYTVPSCNTDDEKSDIVQVQMTNEIHREGFVTYIRSKPVNGSVYTSLPPRERPDPLCVD